MSLLLAISSCGSKDPIVPNPNPGDGDHPVQWSYDLPAGSLADIYPAIDENDNIYLSLLSEDGQNIITIALNKDGNELWQNETPGIASTHPVYSNGKVFVTTEDPVSIECLDANNGNILWTYDLTESYDASWIPSISVNNDKVYLSTGQFFYGFLIAYDFSGNELWVKQNSIMGTSFNLSTIGNQLYFSDDQYVYRYDDNGSSCDSVWAYKYITTKSTNGLMEALELPINVNGNICFRDANNILIVSPSGELVNSFYLDGFDNSPSNITINSDNEILIGNTDLYKFSIDGSIVWSTDINDGLIVNPYFSSAPLICANGNYYDAQSFGLYSVKSNGELNWKENSETGAGIEYGNLHSPVFTHSGDIISVSSEQKKVRCFKGDGQGLPSQGWPKPYGDYGNTSSK